jgi:dipeptidyl aminopeptidase/acylaminoacyl peptidase
MSAIAGGRVDIAEIRDVTRQSRFLSFIAICCLAASGAAQKIPLDHSVYDSGRNSSATIISNDGKFLVWGSRPLKGDGDLYLVELETNKTTHFERGSAPRFTENGHFLLITRLPAEADVEKAKKEKKKPEEMPKNALVIVDTSTGAAKVIERLSTFSVAQEGSAWIAYRTEPIVEQKPPAAAAKQEGEQPAAPQQPKKRKGHAVGREITLLELATGREIKLSDVGDFDWQKDGSAFVYAVSTKDGVGDGLYRLQPSEGKSTAIAEGMSVYKSIAVHDDGKVAYLSDARTYLEKTPSWDLYLWRPGREARMVVQADNEAFPESWEITDRGAIRFSKRGQRLLFNTHLKADTSDETKTEIAAEDKVSVDIWNWRDPLIQPMQLKRIASVQGKTYEAMADLGSGKVLQLETEEIPNVTLADEGDGEIALGSNSDVYGPMVSYDGSYNDYYLINLQNGKRSLISKQTNDGIQLSPSGKWLVWFDGETGAWYARRSEENAQTIEISKGIPYSLRDELHDSPDEPGSYGAMGWDKTEDRFLIYDNFDIWSVDPLGRKEPLSLTRGAGRAATLRLRAIRTDSEERTWDISKPIVLSAENLSTMDSGFYRLDANTGLARLLFGDSGYDYRGKAKDADVVLIARHKFNEYPDIWSTNLRFEDPIKRSEINPQMKDYLWGTAELTSWLSDDGVPLKGVLYKPEGYDPTKKYPMIVYFYERLSDQLHTFFGPGPGSSSVSIPFYVSRGYVVFTPDIPYEIGYPGESAESAIVPGVLSLIDKGIADPKRIGIQGHSWGGYQVAHLVTRTNLFACAEAGAPVSDMFSAYGGIRWGSGMSRQFQYEKTQSRIGGTIWEKPLQFIENSPVFWADKVRTPLLILHNDQDGAVPWYQGIEMYMALRRLNKPVWLINYNGEDHGIGKVQNRKDWAIRLQQFFDHYLLDAPAPKWMTEGVPATRKGEDLGLGFGGG